MSETDLDSALDGLWLLFAPVARGRVDVLEQYVQTGAVPREQAVQAAHRLAGALGSYGRPGSEQAARLEELLTLPGDPPELAGLVAALRSAVGT